LKEQLQSVSSDKTNWFKNHSMSEEQRKKLIESKVQRYLNQIEFTKKAIALK